MRALGSAAAASAIYLILEFGHPYSGLFRISPEGIDLVIAELSANMPSSGCRCGWPLNLAANHLLASASRRSPNRNCEAPRSRRRVAPTVTNLPTDASSLDL